MKLFQNFKTKKLLRKELEYYKDIERVTHRQPYFVEELRLTTFRSQFAIDIDELRNAPPNGFIQKQLVHGLVEELLKSEVVKIECSDDIMRGRKIWTAQIRVQADRT